MKNLWVYVRACYGQECTIILATDAVRLPACGGLRLRPASRRRSRCRSDIAMANRNAALRRSRSEARRRHESHASPVRHERRRVDGAHANCVAFYGCAGAWWASGPRCLEGPRVRGRPIQRATPGRRTLGIGYHNVSRRHVIHGPRVPTGAATAPGLRTPRGGPSRA